MDNALEGIVETWKTAAGQTVRIDDMTTDHVRNALRQLARDPAVARAMVALRLAIELAKRQEDAAASAVDDSWNEHMSEHMAFGSG